MRTPARGVTLIGARGADQRGDRVAAAGHGCAPACDSIWLAALDAEAGAPVDGWRWKVELSDPDRLRLDDLFVDGFQYDYERVSAVYR